MANEHLTVHFGVTRDIELPDWCSTDGDDWYEWGEQTTHNEDPIHVQSWCTQADVLFTIGRILMRFEVDLHEIVRGGSQSDIVLVTSRWAWSEQNHLGCFTVRKYFRTRDVSVRELERVNAEARGWV